MRSKTTNVANFNVKKVEGNIRTPLKSSHVEDDPTNGGLRGKITWQIHVFILFKRFNIIHNTIWCVCSIVWIEGDPVFRGQAELPSEKGSKTIKENMGKVNDLLSASPCFPPLHEDKIYFKRQWFLVFLSEFGMWSKARLRRLLKLLV